MGSSDNKPGPTSQSILRWIGLIVALVTALMKFIVALPAFICFLENHRSHFLVSKFLILANQLNGIPWGTPIFVICCCLILAACGIWIPWVKDPRRWWATIERKSKTNELHSHGELARASKEFSTDEQFHLLDAEFDGDISKDETKVKRAFLKTTWADQHQLQSREQYPLYMQLLRTAPTFLRLDGRLLQQRLLDLGVDLPLLAVNLLLHHPYFVLNRKYWPALCNALFAHERFIECGRPYDYHKHWHKLRLMRYHKLGRVNVYLFFPFLNEDLSNFNVVSAKQLRSIIKLAEEELAEHYKQKLTDIERSDL